MYVSAGWDLSTDLPGYLSFLACIGAMRPSHVFLWGVSHVMHDYGWYGFVGFGIACDCDCGEGEATNAACADCIGS